MINNRKSLLALWICVGLLGVLIAGPLVAQEDSQYGPQLNVPLNGATVFTTNSAISRVVTGKSDVVSLQVVNSRQIVIFGTNQGATTLHVWTDQGLIERLLVVQEAASQSVGSDIQSLLSSNTDTEGNMQMRVFSPQYREVSEFKNYIQELLGQEGEVLLTDPASGKLFVVGKTRVLDQINELIGRLDVPGENKVYSKRLSLQNRPVTQLEEQISKLLSDQGKLVTDRETNSFLVVDTVSKVKSIREYINKIDVPTVAQVRIKTRFVEMSEGLESQLGIDWRVDDNVSGASNEIVSFSGNDGLQIDLINAGDFNEIEASALETKTNFNLISSPSLVTRNQQEATLEIMNEISYLEGCQVTQNQGGGSQASPQVGTVEDGVELAVTPLIGKNDIVQLNIEPVLQLVSFSDRVGTVSTDCGPIQFPEVDRRTANLNVALKDGQTLVLGGLSRQEEDPSVSRVPLLGSMPLVGGFFRSTTKDNQTRTINIFVTVDIIRFTNSSDSSDTIGQAAPQKPVKKKTIKTDQKLFGP